MLFRSEVRYLREIVLALGRADRQQFGEVRRFFADMPQPVTILWNDSDRLRDLYQTLEDNGLSPGPDGKGRSCWMAYGYVIARGESDIIALHDCDIKTYTREIVARLCHPIANPDIDFAFCKGFYARVTDRMHGRATRLYVTPLIRSLQSIVGYLPILNFLDSFRYPLAGEFAMYANLARLNRIPGDWGLEIGVLAEVFRNLSVRRVCQSEVCERYEHKHQVLSGDDPSKGLLKMTIDIGKILLRTLAAEGVMLSEGALKSIQANYIRVAEDTITRYQADAQINGLAFDRHAEEEAVAAFAHGLKLACESYWADPLGISLIPNWNRVSSALPGFLDRLAEAVMADNHDSGAGS